MCMFMYPTGLSLLKERVTSFDCYDTFLDLDHVRDTYTFTHMYIYIILDMRSYIEYI